MNPLRLQVPLLVASLATLAAAPLAHAQEPALAPAEAEAEAEAEAISLHVELVTDTLVKVAKTATAAELERQLPLITKEHGLIRREREQAALFVRLELNQPDKSAEVFFVHTIAVYQGEVLQRDDARTCIQCTAGELIEDGLKIIPVALKLIAEQQAEQAKQAAALAKAAAAEQRQLSEQAAAAPTPARLGPLAYVGVAASVLGLGSTVVGGVLLARGQVQGPGDAYWLEVIDYRPPGKALIGAGLGTMVLGNVLLALDLTLLAQRRRARLGVKLDSVSFMAFGTPGVALGGRF